MAPLRKPVRSYRIWVKYNEESPARILYTGPWNSKAQYIWNANDNVYLRRIRAVITEQDLIEFLHIHPDMPLLDQYLDEWYELEGDVSDPPNRLANFERLAAVQEAERRNA